MQSPAPPDYLDVPSLLERSQPRAHAGWLWYSGGAFLLIVLISTFLSNQSTALEGFVRAVSYISLVGIIGVMMGVTWLAVRRQRGEMQQLEAIAELVQLRRWPEAAYVLRGMLSEPTRTPAARVQGLIFLSAVLARYHRFADAILVQEHLLDHVHLDDSTAHALRLGRAMAMLREDRLFDADRAIADLRRNKQGTPSAGLALVEIYRDVKTGHPAEAIDMFDAMLPAMRDQLGHRVGDAWALVARAYDLLGRDIEARRAFDRATVLSPIAELLRRYPEVAPLAQKYAPTRAAGGCVISAEAVIARVRRDLQISALVKSALVIAAFVVIVWRGFSTSGFGDALLLTLIGGAWLALSYRSFKGSRLAADSQWLIATGEYDAAEQQIEQSLKTFSLFRNAKLLGMHRLAMLRHAQRRWPDAVALCRALLAQRLGALSGLSKPARLILAESLLEMDDTRGARDALAGLFDQRLSLSEALTMQAVQVDYQGRTGAWEQMMDRIATKVQLAELMPTTAAARTQAMLALAAKKTGRHDWASWLRQRVELLADVQELCARRQILWELWAIEDPQEKQPPPQPAPAE